MSTSHSGVHYLLQGMRLLREPGLRRYVAVPLLVSTLCFAGAIYGLAFWLDILLDGLLGKLPEWLDWLRYLLWPVFALAALLVVFYGFTILTNLVAAPFNGMLAEAVEQHLSGQPIATGGWRELLADTVPSLLSELRKLLYFALRAVPLGVLFLIPGINIAAPVLWALFSAWMLAIEYSDFPMANHRLLFTAQRRLLRSRRGLAYGFGGATLLLTLVPVLNFIAMPAAVAGATAMWVGEFKNKKGSDTFS
jgi:CysZ protein